MKYTLEKYEFKNLRRLDENYYNLLINQDTNFNYQLLFKENFDCFFDLVKSNSIYLISNLSDQTNIGCFIYSDKKILYLIIEKKFQNKKHASTILKDISTFIFEKIKEPVIYVINKSNNIFANKILIKNHYKFDQRYQAALNYSFDNFDLYYLTNSMLKNKKIYPIITFQEYVTLNKIEVKGFINDELITEINCGIQKNRVIITNINTHNIFFEQIEDILIRKCYEIIVSNKYDTLELNNYYLQNYNNTQTINFIEDLMSLFTQSNNKLLLVNSIINNKYLYCYLEILSINNCEYNLLYNYKIIKKKNEYSTMTVVDLSGNKYLFKYFVEDNRLIVAPLNNLSKDIIAMLKYLEEQNKCLYTIFFSYESCSNLNFFRKKQILI